MCRKILQLFLTLLASIVGILAFLVFFLRIELLNADHYKAPLADSQIYKILPTLVKSKLSESEQDLIKQFTAKELSFDQLTSNQKFSQLIASKILLHIIDKINLQSSLQTTVEQNLDYVFAWVNNREDTIYIYLPKQQLVQSVTQDDLLDIAVELVHQIYQLDKLPICEISSIDLDQLPPNCYNDQFDILLKAEIQNQIGPTDINFVQAIIDSSGVNISEKTAISEFVKNKPDNNLEDSLAQAKTYIIYFQIISIAGVFVFIFLALIAAAFSYSHKFLSFLLNFLFVFILSLSGVFVLKFYFLAPLVKLIPYDRINISDKILTLEQATQLKSSLQSLVNSLIDSTINKLLLFYTLAFFVNLLLIIGFLLWQKKIQKIDKTKASQ